jgi:hypothetical protein
MWHQLFWEDELRFLFTAIAWLYIAGAAFAEQPHPPYCEPTQDPGIAENNVSAIPEGHVNNILVDLWRYGSRCS